ncbi:hypothetical protein EVA_08099 [gut metagenome]|uniref:Uncharacterized protein n=1 Tax=gut metagenome TaxID=749906 RepID=J9GTT7_9ZZZZ
MAIFGPKIEAWSPPLAGVNIREPSSSSADRLEILKWFLVSL